MQTQPPYLVNQLLFGGRLGPVPPSDWLLFCDKPTALVMLADCQTIDPEAKLVDVIHDRTIPAGSERLPFPQIQQLDLTSNVSAYMIVGRVPLKDGTTALLSEFAGWLADAKAGVLPIPDPLDTQAHNIGHGGTSKAFAYVAIDDPSDSEIYWADAPVLGGLAA